MGNTSGEEKKYVLLYGNPQAGKTFFEYGLVTDQNDINTNLLEITSGINYEEYKTKNDTFGIFDISGDIQQYELANIIAKSVEICGIIFIVNLDKIENIDISRDSLYRILGNNFLKNGLFLFIIYNENPNNAGCSWISSETLNERLEVTQIKEKFGVKEFTSVKVDLSNYNKKYLFNLILKISNLCP